MVIRYWDAKPMILSWNLQINHAYTNSAQKTGNRSSEETGKTLRLGLA